MPELVLVLAVGVIAIIITLFVGFIVLRIDNSRTIRENIRMQTAIARSGGMSGSYQSGSSTNDEGEMGWISTILGEVIKNNPELVTQFLGAIKKE